MAEPTTSCNICTFLENRADMSAGQCRDGQGLMRDIPTAMEIYHHMVHRPLETITRPAGGGLCTPVWHRLHREVYMRTTNNTNLSGVQAAAEVCNEQLFDGSFARWLFEHQVVWLLLSDSSHTQPQPILPHGNHHMAVYLSRQAPAYKRLSSVHRRRGRMGMTGGHDLANTEAIPLHRKWPANPLVQWALAQFPCIGRGRMEWKEWNVCITYAALRPSMRIRDDVLIQHVTEEPDRKRKRLHTTTVGHHQNRSVKHKCQYETLAVLHEMIHVIQQNSLQILLSEEPVIENPQLFKDDHADQGGHGQMWQYLVFLLSPVPIQSHVAFVNGGHVVVHGGGDFKSGRHLLYPLWYRVVGPRQSTHHDTNEHVSLAALNRSLRQTL